MTSPRHLFHLIRYFSLTVLAVIQDKTVLVFPLNLLDKLILLRILVEEGILSRRIS